MFRKKHSGVFDKSKCSLESDLFEELKDDLRCDYVSDIASEPYVSTARSLMKHRKLNLYPLSMLEDMANYLYKRKCSFRNEADAVAFFNCIKEQKICS